MSEAPARTGVALGVLERAPKGPTEAPFAVQVSNSESVEMLIRPNVSSPEDSGRRQLGSPHYADGCSLLLLAYLDSKFQIFLNNAQLFLY